MFTFSRKALYYETDQMGIVHHSNYIRWFEEARIALMDAIGLPYKEMEAHGVVIPVVSVTCNYKSPVRFDETLDLSLTVHGYRGARFTVRYVGVNRDTGLISCTGESAHCFTNREVHPIRLKNTFPAWHEKLLAVTEPE